MIKKGKEYNILKDAVETLKNVTKDDILFIDYVKICYCAMKFSGEIQSEKTDNFPVHMEEIFRKLEVDVRVARLNENIMDEEERRVNRIIGKISVRPDYFSGKDKKVTVYVGENEKRSVINYALAHELCHLLLYIRDEATLSKFYTDDYCSMPMLPKKIDELVADAFAIFTLIPLDKFFSTFKEYIQSAKQRGDLPIGTEEWLNYLSAVTRVPYYYVACGYQQIRHVTSVMYQIHKVDKEKRKEYCDRYGKEIILLYEMVKEYLDEGTVCMLYQ